MILLDTKLTGDEGQPSALAPPVRWSEGMMPKSKLVCLLSKRRVETTKKAKERCFKLAQGSDLEVLEVGRHSNINRG